VIVRLNTSHSPAISLESDAARSQRRAGIQSARDAMGAGLRSVPHRVVREFEDLPFVALEVGMDGLQALESFSGGVAEVLEDRLHRPFLAESVPPVQADQAWAGTFAGTPLDGAGMVVAISTPAWTRPIHSLAAKQSMKRASQLHSPRALNQRLPGRMVEYLRSGQPRRATFYRTASTAPTSLASRRATGRTERWHRSPVSPEAPTSWPSRFLRGSMTFLFAFHFPAV
jgi:hypothetical protein